MNLEAVRTLGLSSVRALASISSVFSRMASLPSQAEDESERLASEAKGRIWQQPYALLSHPQVQPLNVRDFFLIHPLSVKFIPQQEKTELPILKRVKRWRSVRYETVFRLKPQRSSSFIELVQ